MNIYSTYMAIVLIFPVERPPIKDISVAACRASRVTVPTIYQDIFTFPSDFLKLRPNEDI